MFFQIVAPAGSDRGIELAAAGQGAQLAVVEVASFVHRQQVVAHLAAESFHDLAVVFVDVGLQLPVFLFQKSLVVAGQFGVRVGPADDGELLRFLDAGEHAVERVVVAHGNGIVFVVVTTGAGQGEAE